MRWGSMDNKNVLIVDDEVINFYLLDNLIDPIHTVLVATNGKDALIRAEKCVPDLILLDLALPDMHGVTVCQHLKENPQTKYIPIIIVSASDPNQYGKTMKALGVTEFFVKPFDSYAVKQKISDYLT